MRAKWILVPSILYDPLPVRFLFFFTDTGTFPSNFIIAFYHRCHRSLVPLTRWCFFPLKEFRETRRIFLQPKREFFFSVSLAKKVYRIRFDTSVRMLRTKFGFFVEAFPPNSTAIVPFCHGTRSRNLISHPFAFYRGHDICIHYGAVISYRDSTRSACMCARLTDSALCHWPVREQRASWLAKMTLRHFMVPRIMSV